MVLLGFDRKSRITASAAVPLALIILLKSYIHSDTVGAVSLDLPYPPPYKPPHQSPQSADLPSSEPLVNGFSRGTPNLPKSPTFAMFWWKSLSRVSGSFAPPQ